MYNIAMQQKKIVHAITPTRHCTVKKTNCNNDTAMKNHVAFGRGGGGGLGVGKYATALSGILLK